MYGVVSTNRASVPYTTFSLPNSLHLNNANEWEYYTTFMIGKEEGRRGHRIDYLMEGGTMMTNLRTVNETATISARNLATLIWSMSMIRVGPDDPTGTWPDLPLSAMECSLFYCVNSYKFEVSNGSLIVATEQITDAKRVKVGGRLVRLARPFSMSQNKKASHSNGHPGQLIAQT
jgi:hypothetical protein